MVVRWRYTCIDKFKIKFKYKFKLFLDLSLVLNLNLISASLLQRHSAVG